MTEKFVPIEDVAQHLTVSIATVRTWFSKGLIPESAYIKVGRTYRFQLSEVVKALTVKNETQEEN